MIKLDVKYTDFNDVEREKPCYFHLGEYDLTALDAQYPMGLQTYINEMLEKSDKLAAFDLITTLITKSYGIKSEDGSSFLRVGTDGRPLTETFPQTALFQGAFAMVTSSEEAMNKFVLGILPPSARNKIEKLQSSGELSNVANFPTSKAE